MPTFLWSGKDAEGKKRSERIDAENAQAARAQLESRGWSNLELVKDELAYSEAIRVKTTKPVDPDIAAKFSTPDAEASFHKRGWKTSVLGRTLDSIAESWKLTLLCAALLGWGIYRHLIFTTIFGALGLAFVVLFIPVYHVLIRLLGNTSTDFARLNRAKVWGRWDEVLECVERLRQPDRMTGSLVPELELIKSRAGALAALGRLDEGLAEYQKLENDPKVERWMYLSFLAGIYDNARQFQKGLELRREAAAIKPDTSMTWIDVAYSSVRKLNHTDEAREALARAEQLEISGLGKKYLPFLRGIIAWREHRPEEARPLLEEALAGFQPIAHNPLAEGLILSAKAFLCATYVDLRDYARAKPLQREVEPFLTAHREDDLLAACRSAMVPA
jgi:hypothetical protein